jgi:hypothetical protein
MEVSERMVIEWQCARLIALYATLNDEARWDELAALYTDDAAMIRPTAPGQPIVGRAAILAAFKARAPRATRHLCSNVVIDVVSPTEARGSSAMVLFTKLEPPLVGSFHDRFVLSQRGWLFAERRGSLAFIDLSTLPD